MLSTETTAEELVELITSSQSKSRITFTDDDLSPEGVNRNKLLYMTLKYRVNLIHAYIVNSKFAWNVCPLRTTVRLGMDESDMTPLN